MRFAAFCATLSLASFLASCRELPSGRITDEQRTEIEQAIKQQAEDYLSALRTLDVELLMSHFAKDDLSFVANGVHYPSYDAVLEIIKGVAADWKNWEGGWDKVQVKVPSPDTALFHGSFHATTTDTAGEKRHFPEGFWTALYERRDGQWKMVLVHESYRPPSTEQE